MEEFKISELDVPFTFQSRPESIPADFRPLWRIALIVLILQNTRGNKSSLGRLHVLNWALRSQENREELKRLLEKKISPDSLIIRIEPSLNRAIDLAIGHKLVDLLSGNKIQISKDGVTFSEDLLSTNNIFVQEKLFLNKYGRKITESIVQTLFKRSF